MKNSFENFVKQSVEASRAMHEHLKEHTCEKCMFVLDEIVLCESCSDKMQKEINK